MTSRRTRRHRSRSATRGWARAAPQTMRQRKRMMKRCGKKCFLGPKLSYPVCKRGSCKVSRMGVQSAYNRAKQFHRRSIAATAKRWLKRMGF